MTDRRGNDRWQPPSGAPAPIPGEFLLPNAPPRRDQSRPVQRTVAPQSRPAQPAVRGAQSQRITQPARGKRKPHPARSARILSTGLAATATLGLISGYASAAKPTSTDGVDPNSTSPSVALSPVETAPTQQSTDAVGAQSQPVTTQAPAVQAPAPVVVPVPAPAAPAQKKSSSSSGSSQSSSGSR